MLDPDSQTVTLINMGAGPDGQQSRPYKMKTKIRLVNSDASFLQDGSQLDTSQNASYIVGDIFDHGSKLA